GTGEHGGPPGHGAPIVAAASGPLTLADGGRTLLVVNPDSDSVTAVDVTDPEEPKPTATVAVGGEPWAVALAPDGTAIVMNRRSGSLSFLQRDGPQHGTWRVIDETYVGPEPGGVVLSANGARAYVTLSGDAAVAVVEVAARRVVERIAVGPLPWAIACSDDTLIVAHRLARPVEGRSPTADDGREGWLTLIDLGEEPSSATSEVVLAGNAFGFPNALEGLAVVDEVVYAAH